MPPTVRGGWPGLVTERDWLGEVKTSCPADER